MDYLIGEIKKGKIICWNCHKRLILKEYQKALKTTPEVYCQKCGAKLTISKKTIPLIKEFSEISGIETWLVSRGIKREVNL